MKMENAIGKNLGGIGIMQAIADLNRGYCGNGSPWGKVQCRDFLASGLTFVSTASHGGFKLNGRRWKQFKARYPGFKSVTGLGHSGWLEEDCEATLAMILWFDELYPVESLIATPLSKLKEYAVKWFNDDGSYKNS